MVESAASSTESITIRIGIAALTQEKTTLDGRNCLTVQLNPAFLEPSDHSLSVIKSVICSQHDELVKFVKHFSDEEIGPETPNAVLSEVIDRLNALGKFAMMFRNIGAEDYHLMQFNTIKRVMSNHAAFGKAGRGEW